MKPNIVQLHTISDLGHLLGQEVLHPQVTVIDFARLGAYNLEDMRVQCDFYVVMFKCCCPDRLRWGQQPFDFQEGSLVCISPKQLIDFENSTASGGGSDGWALFFHPDVLKGTPLGARMREYTFFSYQLSEALHLSDKERNTLTDCVQKIEEELANNMDDYSLTLVLTNIELLLNYCMRYYGRQFITRHNYNRRVVEKVEQVLQDYLAPTRTLSRVRTHDWEKFPTASVVARRLCLSSDYLSDLLRKEVGLSAKDYIHYRLIEEAKERLLTTGKTVNEISFDLGFEYPQYFTRLFKSKTGQTPVEYRQANNI